MSDFKAIEISDILGLSKPLEKLLDCISSACGKIYEPKHIKRMAEAHAEEIKTLSDSLKDNPNLLIKYDILFNIFQLYYHIWICNSFFCFFPLFRSHQTGVNADRTPGLIQRVHLHTVA